MPNIKDRVDQSIQKIYAWIAKNQTKEGTWPEPYDGPFFLLPLYIFAMRICNRPPNQEVVVKMTRYILRHQLADGSFGIHQEAKTGMLFTTILNYVALRFLGNSYEKPELIKCLDWIHKQGGPLYAASWTKIHSGLFKFVQIQWGCSCSARTLSFTGLVSISSTQNLGLCADYLFTHVLFFP